jgi:hypothetical protein
LCHFRLVVPTPPTAAVSLVNDRGERKATGSYYTPDYIVDYIVRQTLGPVLEERQGVFAAAMARCAELRGRLAKTLDAGANRQLRGQLEAAESAAREAFLGIKVCDPAMGSGHFLVNAVDFLADGIIQRMQAYHDSHADVPWEWNPIRGMVERVRRDIVAEMARQGISLDPARLDDTGLLTRLVMKRCIYGVDLNPMAVELAKLSLWLHSFTVGAPLSFLDHHLRWGNSLIGVDVRTVEAAIASTDSGQMALWGGPFAGLLDLTAVMTEVAGRADATLADVRQSADEFGRFQRELTPYKQALDLWVSQYFDEGRRTKDQRAAYELLTVHGGDVLPALRGERELAEKYRAAIAEARRLWEEKRFFHWDLEFPEVFVDPARRDWAENPGFDAVIGNPPYVNVVRLNAVDVDFFRSEFATFKNKCDLYSLFLEKGLENAKTNGRVGYVVSNSWFGTDSFSPTRRLLLEENRTERIGIPPEDAFREATVSTVIVITQRRRWQDEELIQVELYDRSTGLFRAATVFLCREVSERCERAINFHQPAGYLQMLSSMERNSLPLSSVCEFSLGVKTSNDTEFVHRGWRDRFDVPVIRGKDVERYSVQHNDEFLHYDVDLIRSRHGARPRQRSAFERSEKIVIQEIAGTRLICSIDRVAMFCLDTVNVAFSAEGTSYGLAAIAALLNSRALNFWYGSQHPGSHVKLNEIAVIPIPRISFTTPAADRACYADEGHRLYERFCATGDPAAVLAFVDAHLSPAPASSDQLPASGRSDVIHDLLAHLAEQMIATNGQKQTEVKGFLAWLGREIGAAPDALTGKSRLLDYLGDYQKAEPHVSLDELLDILRKNRRKLATDPSGRAFQEHLAAEYEASLSKLLPLKQRLAATDRLIDQVVYRLYGLTEAEIVVVDGKP